MRQGYRRDPVAPDLRERNALRPPPVQADRPEDENMDFDKATAAHAEWKVKLRVALQDHGSLDAERVCSDKHCELGQWLHGEARAKFSSRPAYLSCVEAHRDFHQCAGDIAQAINRKDYEAAEQLLDTGSRFAHASSQVAVAIRRLRREVEGGA